MSVLTDLLKLLKMDAATDGSKTFNIKTMLNDNWDKIEAFCKTVKGHIDDAVKHITADERTAWNAKETTTGAQEKADTAERNAITAASADATSKANAAEKNAKDTSVPRNLGTIKQSDLDTTRVAGNYNFIDSTGVFGELEGLWNLEVIDTIYSGNLSHSITQRITQIYPINARQFIRVYYLAGGGWSTWVEVYSSAFKPFVTGTYTGNGQLSKFINLGFTPSAVIVFNKTYGFNDEGRNYVGGIAITDVPFIPQLVAQGTVCIEVSANGFTTHQRVQSGYVSGRLNEANNTYTFIAFRY